MKSYKILPCLCLFMLWSCTQTSSLSTNERNAYQWQYELEAQNTGTQGTYLIKVWSYAKDADLAIGRATKNAVHGVLFKGVPDNGRITGQKALIRDKETKQANEAYFTNFFREGGPYQRYVNLTNSGAILPGDRQKLGNGEDAHYKIGMIVSVNVADLRKHLEEDGIIKPLDAGF